MVGGGVAAFKEMRRKVGGRLRGEVQNAAQAGGPAPGPCRVGLGYIAER